MSIIYQSKVMLQVLEQARRFARSSVTVLLNGESGTGKELIARLIYQHSPRKEQTYLRINCAALSESLIESELFGHEAGAFTGAQIKRQGLFETAQGGTVFLDEIGELPYHMQAKLLRILEEQEFQRVGGNETLRFDGRFLTATNRDLSAECEAGQFREDLFYRISVLTLTLPPLRDRREDIPPLVQHFIRQSQPQLDRPVRGVSRSVMEKLCEYHWPGNVRELRNVVLRFCILATSEVVDHVDLPEPASPTSSKTTTSRSAVPEERRDVLCFQTHAQQALQLPPQFETLSLEEIERQVILHRLHNYQGNKTEAAAALGVTTRTLRNKVLHYRKLGYVS